MCTGLEVALLTAATAIRAGNQQNNQAKFQAALQHQQAERARQEAAAQAWNIRRQRSREASRLRARLASSGVDTSSGSALLSLETLSGDSEFEALTAINQGAARAFSADADASGLISRGAFAKQSGLLSAGTTLLKAGEQVIKKDREPRKTPKTAG